MPSNEYSILDSSLWHGGMTNIGGTPPNRRHFLMSAALSVLVYDAEVWASDLGKERYRKPFVQKKDGDFANEVCLSHCL